MQTFFLFHQCNGNRHRQHLPPVRVALFAMIMGGSLLVTGNSLLVTRDFPTPRRAKHDTPRPHKQGRWALVRFPLRCPRRPVAHENYKFRGARYARPTFAERNIIPQWYVLSSPPLEGCREAAGWLSRIIITIILKSVFVTFFGRYMSIIRYIALCNCCLCTGSIKYFVCTVNGTGCLPAYK